MKLDEEHSESVKNDEEFEVFVMNNKDQQEFQENDEEIPATDNQKYIEKDKKEFELDKMYESWGSENINDLRMIIEQLEEDGAEEEEE